MKPGDAFVRVAALAWLSVSVGPWWLGAAILLVGWALNALAGQLQARRILAQGRLLDGDAAVRTG